MYVSIIICVMIKLTHESDAPTPQGKAEQILSVAPILPGQSLHQPQSQQPNSHDPMNNGPPQIPDQRQPQAPPQISHQVPLSQAGGDLIDFGDGNQLHATTQPAPMRQPSPYQAMGGAPSGLQEPLRPGQPLQRVDTATNDVDEFVDAKP